MAEAQRLTATAVSANPLVCKFVQFLVLRLVCEESISRNFPMEPPNQNKVAQEISNGCPRISWDLPGNIMGSLQRYLGHAPESPFSTFPPGASRKTYPWSFPRQQGGPENHGKQHVF